MTDLTAKDIMTRDVIVVQDTMSLSELAGVLMSNMITGAPVVDDAGKLVGVVSSTDVVRGTALEASSIRQESSYYLHGWEDEINEEELPAFRVVDGAGMRVQDIMTSTIFSVPESAGMAEMADAMIRGRIHRLIVTRGARVVGIVTTLDLLRAVRDSGGGL